MSIRKSIIYIEINDKKLLNLLLSRQGGKTTAKILESILKKPQNKNQIANSLNVDYNTITYHMNIICKYDYVVEEKIGEKNIYYPSDKFLKSLNDFERIKEFFTEEENEEEP